MTRVLVSAASRHGATAEIGERIAANLRDCGIDAEFRPPDQVQAASDYDAFVLGSGVYAGHWLPAAVDLCDRIGSDLAGRPVWLFSSGPVGPEDSKLVKKMWVDPVDLERVRERIGAAEHRMFAGKLVRAELSRGQRAALFFFKRLAGDFRDWPAVQAWSTEIASALRGAGVSR